MDEKLSIKEFVTYSCPRYYRLIFPELRDADTILTSVKTGEVIYGLNLRKVIKKIKNSMEDIISMKNQSLAKRDN